MKKPFAVIVLAVLILAALPVLTLPNVKASASEARVLTSSWYIAPSPTILAAEPGDLVVVGEIQNVGSNIIQNVTLTGAAYDSNGTELGSSQGTAYVYETPPEGKAPFSIDFPPSSSISTTTQNWASQVTRVTITVLSVTDTVVPPYAGLVVPEAPYGFNNSGTYTTVGTIINNGSETVGNVWVVTTFYNSAGTVVDLNFTNYVNTPLSPLAPGHPSRWVATPADNTAQITNEITSFSYVIDSMPFSSSASGQATPTPTASGASSAFPLAAIIVVVVIVVIAVVAFMLFRKKPEAAQPTPPLPPPPPTS